MIWQTFIKSLLYVMSDQYFLPSVGLTTSMGIFLGATLYDGLLGRYMKALVSMSMYGFLIIVTTCTRIVPLINDGVFRVHHPFSGVATILLISIAYFLGMTLGVLITGYANRIKKIKNENLIPKR